MEGYKIPNYELGLAAMHRLCKKTGAERVSESAAKELAIILEEYGVKIARDAFSYAMHAVRKTVKDRDIKIAAK